MKTIHLIIILITCSGLSSCNKEKENLVLSDSSPKLLSLTNLIQNPSFELNGQSSLQYWNYTWGSCCLDSFSTDTAPGGGNYALQLEPMWVPAEGAVETYITGISSNHSFSLNFYGKTVNTAISKATASVYLKNTSFASIFTLSFNNPQWTQYTLTTSPLAIQSSDTLVVKLSAGGTEVANWKVLFDNIELYELPN